MLYQILKFIFDTAFLFEQFLEKKRSPKIISIKGKVLENFEIEIKYRNFRLILKI